ncbi:toll/interleukin-1 receptor domain-containing protein [Cryptosporangium aurantiacum]|uniref:TIR domain-containing protein n=1 Tax=Cryptosporangium aurantiacum TaxID=134849 RepID=A0A1M7RJH6_9ACTN|nr:toll/interleukin-1 receptor domain-containing protein [Cryptosporangium aurantiacum]SHN46301.1 TIR domain-containing protein [Cryptosporangium aurantiacum]
MPGTDLSGERRDFFVSYTEADHEWATWIAWQLEEAGYTVLIQAWDMVPGSNWIALMDHGTKRAERTVAVLSRAYLENSAFGAAEWHAAYRQDPTGLAGRLIPIRVENCTVEGLLAGVVHVDLFGFRDKTEARTGLLTAVAAAIERRSKPLAEPGFPGAGKPAATPAVSDPHRSAYLAQVGQIAPPILLGREAELAAMAAFCTDAASRPYLWWRAEAWAGKSALMSTFALNPPPGVRVVSFFITSRYPGNSDRAAFVEAVNEQLAEVAGELLPSNQTPAARERSFAWLLGRAVERCTRDGQQLVLLVDGLDEDRGLAGGPDDRSVAALLPKNPPAPLRVVVAGRPNPPIPEDVPPGHPLHDPAIVRTLHPSERAETLRASMRSDLHRLWAGNTIEQDLLGFMTAAGGGLSGPDLAALCASPHPALAGVDASDVTEWDIERRLSTVAGRSFSRRASRWRPDEGPAVYLLGHEEIHTEATRYYGPRRLAGYRERLHVWAETYRDRGWPPETPEYLVRGYFQLLLTTGELTRAVECALDQARHDLLLSLSGGDAAALAEITGAQDALLAQERPELEFLARLAIERANIDDRNTRMPALLPAVWAMLGSVDRGLQIARSMTDRGQQAGALVALTGVVARAGDHRYAERIARTISSPGSQAHALVAVAESVGTGHRGLALRLTAEAEAVARTDYNPFFRARALAALASTRAGLGNHEDATCLAAEAEKIARSDTRPDSKSRLLTACAGVAGCLGDRAHALRLAEETERIARSITRVYAEIHGLTSIATVLSDLGERGYASRLIADAERLALTDPTLNRRAQALKAVIVALAAMGDEARAKRLAVEAERCARKADQHRQPRELAAAASAFAFVGDTTRAERIALSISAPGWKAGALAELARTAVRRGHTTHAMDLAIAAERSARAISLADVHARNLEVLAGAIACTGDHRFAETIARSITDPNSRAVALAAVAKSAVQNGHRDWGRALLRDAESSAARGAGSESRTVTLVAVAEALAFAGDNVAATRVARSISNPWSQVNALCAAACAAADAGEEAYAADLAHDAEQTAWSAADSTTQSNALAVVAETSARLDDRANAARVARSVTDPVARTKALSGLARAATDGTYARSLIQEAERVARAVPGRDSRTEALLTVANAAAHLDDQETTVRLTHDLPGLDTAIDALSTLIHTMATRGDADLSEKIARSITSPASRARALTVVADEIARAGDSSRAIRLMTEAEELAQSTTNIDRRARLCFSLACTAARVGHHDRARRHVAEGLSQGTWHRLPLASIANVTPEVLVALANTVSGRHADAAADAV